MASCKPSLFKPLSGPFLHIPQPLLPEPPEIVKLSLPVRLISGINYTVISSFLSLSLKWLHQSWTALLLSYLTCFCVNLHLPSYQWPHRGYLDKFCHDLSSSDVHSSIHPHNITSAFLILFFFLAGRG